jgi:hypothetical protein
MRQKTNNSEITMSLISRLVPTSTATAAVTATDGAITSLRIIKDGSGYKAEPTVTIYDTGGGTGAVVKATLSEGKVVNLEVVSGGTGYKVPVVIIEAPGKIVPRSLIYKTSVSPGAPGRAGLSRSNQPHWVVPTQDLIG